MDLTKSLPYKNVCTVCAYFTPAGWWKCEELKKKKNIHEVHKLQVRSVTQANHWCESSVFYFLLFVLFSVKVNNKIKQSLSCVFCLGFNTQMIGEKHFYAKARLFLFLIQVYCNSK